MFVLLHGITNLGKYTNLVLRLFPMIPISIHKFLHFTVVPGYPGQYACVSLTQFVHLRNDFDS